VVDEVAHPWLLHGDYISHCIHESAISTLCIMNVSEVFGLDLDGDEEEELDEPSIPGKRARLIVNEQRQTVCEFDFLH
jgi:hypothetical protein